MGLGRYDEALASLNVGEKTPYSLGWIAGIYILQNKNEAALEVLNQVITMEPGSFWELDSVASKSIINNEKEVGVAALKALEEIDLSDSEPNFYWAGIYAMLGEKEHAIRLLTKAVKFGYYNYPYFQNNKMLDPIRNTPEFQKIMSSVKAKHEVFKAQYKKIKSA